VQGGSGSRWIWNGPSGRMGRRTVRIVSAAWFVACAVLAVLSASGKFTWRSDDMEPVSRWPPTVVFVVLSLAFAFVALRYKPSSQDRA
jgi:preprotein translocase subunit SecG